MSHHDQGADNMAESTIIREVAPEQITRITSGGRKLNYQLGVIQQPERARACGSGAKCMLIVDLILAMLISSSLR